MTIDIVTFRRNVQPTNLSSPPQELQFVVSRAKLLGMTKEDLAEKLPDLVKSFLLAGEESLNPREGDEDRAQSLDLTKMGLELHGYLAGKERWSVINDVSNAYPALKPRGDMIARKDHHASVDYAYPDPTVKVHEPGYVAGNGVVDDSLILEQLMFEKAGE